MYWITSWYFNFCFLLLLLLGIDRASLQLVWDFTTASLTGLTERYVQGGSSKGHCCQIHFHLCTGTAPLLCCTMYLVEVCNQPSRMYVRMVWYRWLMDGSFFPCF